VPLAVRLPVTRRVTGLGSRFDLPGDRPTLNVLVVTARPGGPADVRYRTVSRPLLDALRAARLPVRVDLVRPGPWEALRAHLGAVTEERGRAGARSSTSTCTARSKTTPRWMRAGRRSGCCSARRRGAV
jgi:hypothetical protein